jgi:RNA polymerase sigma-70 factor (ECF subfamily)
LYHSSVKSRVQRGRKKLAEFFQECCTYEVDVRGNIIGYEAKSKCC